MGSGLVSRCTSKLSRVGVGISVPIWSRDFRSEVWGTSMHLEPKHHSRQQNRITGTMACVAGLCEKIHRYRIPGTTSLHERKHENPSSCEQRSILLVGQEHMDPSEFICTKRRPQYHPLSRTLCRDSSSHTNVEVSTHRGPLFGSPYNTLGSILGPPIYGNPH